MSAAPKTPDGKRAKTPTCTYHCAACGSHFSSEVAFDSHRQGTFEGGRYCEEPADVERRDGTLRLAELTTVGECRAYSDVKRGVTVWTDRVGLERVREHFGRDR